MKNLVKSNCAAFCFLVVYCSAALASGAEDDVVLMANPDHIEINAFYNGADVMISAIVPECDGVVLGLEGKAEQMVFNEKGRLGLFWTNLAKVTVKNSPRIYLLSTSGELPNICPESRLHKLGLGYKALKRNVQFQSTKPLTGKEFEEFVKFEKEKGLYGIVSRIRFESTADGRHVFSTIVHVPPIVPPGEYEVLVYSFKDGELSHRASRDFRITRVGLPRVMKTLAQDRPALYGILAVIVAMAGGLVVGLVLSPKRARGH
jgi:uncharacterized protein (TIGR02186 family)